MSKANSSRPGNAAPAVVYSDDVATVAQLAHSAPIAPPQNLEAEESVLGAMLLSPGAIGAVSEVLDASDFYRDSHAKIYRAGLALYAKGEPVDAITIVRQRFTHASAVSAKFDRNMKAAAGSSTRASGRMSSLRSRSGGTCSSTTRASRT